MTASLGIWAEGILPGGVLYRWEADHGDGGSGFVTFDPESQQFRPADSAGVASGGLIIDGDTGDISGTTDGVDPTTLAQVAASVLRAYARAGEPPKTAHAHFY